MLTPSSSVFSSTFFLFCWAAQPEALRAQPSVESWFSLPRTATTDSKLTELPCHTGLYHCLTSTCFLWVTHLRRIQPVHVKGYTLISSTGCTCSLIKSSVGGQYVTGRQTKNASEIKETKKTRQTKQYIQNRMFQNNEKKSTDNWGENGRNHINSRMRERQKPSGEKYGKR